jgi:AcrR family transcriptional regulator
VSGLIGAGEDRCEHAPTALALTVEEPGNGHHDRREQSGVDVHHVGVAAAALREWLDDNVVSPRSDEAAGLVGAQHTFVVVDALDANSMHRERNDAAEQQQPGAFVALLPWRGPVTQRSPVDEATGDEPECLGGANRGPHHVGRTVENGGTVDGSRTCHAAIVSKAHIRFNSLSGELRMARTSSAEPRKQPRQRRSAETVDRILEAAARIFDERGYRSTTTNHVADAAGVSIGSLYQYFPNKDALLVALAEQHVDAAAQQFGERLLDLRGQQPTLDETVRLLLDLTVELNDTSKLHSVLFSECPRTPALTERLARFTELIVDEVAWHLERTGSDGTDHRLRARLTVAAVDAAVHEVVLSEPPGPHRAAATDELCRIIIHGLRPSASPSGRVTTR